VPLRVPLNERHGHRLAFELCTLNWGGAKGTRTPGLLHAMQVRQPACQGISDIYLRR
jgi:hypothetical protein